MGKQEETLCFSTVTPKYDSIITESLTWHHRCAGYFKYPFEKAQKVTTQVSYRLVEELKGV